MQLSKRCEYALRALIDIGIAHEVGRELLPIAELSEHERIPTKFLEQILLQLKVAGYLASKRGKGGGYALKKPLQVVRIGDVVREIDGPLAPIRCASLTAYERCSCPDEEHCGLRMLMVDVRNSTAGILDGRSLQQVVDETLRLLKRDRIRPPFQH